LKAIQLLDDRAVRTGSQGKATLFDQVVWATRCAFFRDCLDIARWEVQSKIAMQFGIKVSAVQELIHSGLAFARLAADYQEADKLRIEGSPSLVLNQGRQKLYGNVGFRIIEANILELLRQP
jgi:predicted DsbA family dithiol-disulfide isomerase